VKPAVPDELFIFVDRTSMLTRHQYELIGGFVSRCAELLATDEGQCRYDSGEIDLLPFKLNPEQYPNVSPFVVKLMTEQWIEYEAERIRRQLYPSVPSRLSAIYAFGDAESCVAVARKYGWDLSTVRRFMPAPTRPMRAVRVNMEVVSLMRTTRRLASWEAEDADAIWSHYWRGDGDLQIQTPDTETLGATRVWESGVTWEWLIEGRLEAVDRRPVFT
jgi:hypothetical protein